MGINAFAYMTVARMVYFGLPDKKIWGVRAVKLTVLFVWLDVVCFLVQLGGGLLLSNHDNANLAPIGMKVYIRRASGCSSGQVRVIFRLLEFGPGIDASNELITNETYPLALDAVPMALALGLLNVMHPGLVLRGPDGEFPPRTRGEKKAMRQRAKEEKKRRKEARDWQVLGCSRHGEVGGGN
ncbi:hypothetical protein MY11210_004866 [Beauveria gryllotalpidicola]